MSYRINRKSCRIHRNACYQLSEAIPVTALCYPERLCHTIPIQNATESTGTLATSSQKPYPLQPYAILNDYAILYQPRMPLNPQERLLLSHWSYTLSSYAILLRYAISDKPDLLNNSVRRFTHILMLPRKNTFFHMLMITYLYAILSRYAILGKPELSNNSSQRLALIWLFPIRNAVNTRLFGAYEPQKIIFDLSHYTKSRPALKSGGFFAWIDRKEAEK